MPQQPQPKQTSWVNVLLTSLAGSLLVGLIALAFLWPTKTAQPKDFPIAITGSNPAQVTAIKSALAQKAEGKIKLVSVANRAEAVDKMKHREAYGALILNLPHPEVLSASANGAAANAIITSLGADLGDGLTKMMAASAPPGAHVPAITVTVTDIIPAYTKSFDIAQLALPLVFGGMIGALLITSLVRGRLARLIALVGYAILAGNVLYGLLHSWFNVLPADYVNIVSAFTLGIFATASFVTGAYVLVGPAGLMAAAVFSLFVANPMSGIAIPPSFLPGPWGEVGQSLTIGAAGTLLRGAVYFPVSEVLIVPIITLSLWSVAGAVAVVSRTRGTFSR